MKHVANLIKNTPWQLLAAITGHTHGGAQAYKVLAQQCCDAAGRTATARFVSSLIKERPDAAGCVTYNSLQCLAHLAPESEQSNSSCLPPLVPAALCQACQPMQLQPCWLKHLGGATVLQLVHCHYILYWQKLCFLLLQSADNDIRSLSSLSGGGCQTQQPAASSCTPRGTVNVLDCTQSIFLTCHIAVLSVVLLCCFLCDVSQHSYRSPTSSRLSAPISFHVQRTHQHLIIG